jgi:hypothetical protein
MGGLTMIAVAQESANAKLVMPAPEVDFALVLSRVIASVEDEPAQYRLRAGAHQAARRGFAEKPVIQFAGDQRS